MTVELATEELATMCFRRVPDDVVGRDVVLAALWHLLLECAKRGIPIEGRTIRHTHLGKRAGLRGPDFRAAVAELEHDGLIGRAANGYCLTPRGYVAVRQIVDVGHTIELAKASQQAA
jgi:hypothetical protein